jgi:predicted transcriptional regulator
MIGLLEYAETIDAIISANKIEGQREQARCRVELANYFTAAVLMPYDAFITRRAARAMTWTTSQPGLASRSNRPATG